MPLFCRYLVRGLAIVCLLLQACNNQDLCRSNQHAAQIRLLSLYASSDKDTTMTVSAHGLGRTDSVYAKESLSSLYLPLDFDGDPDTTSYVLNLDNSTDTLHIVHRKELDFVSGDCGYVFKFDIDTVWFTKNAIDSAYINLSTIKYDENAVNIKLYIY